MNTESIVLVTKDAFCSAYLPCYGNKIWQQKTPNIDELAQKGVVYKKYYTAAPSSAMSYLCMFTGKNPFELGIETFRPLNNNFSEETLFDKANILGFKTHVIWEEGWMKGAYKYSLCYGKNTEIHALKNIKQSVGAQFIHNGELVPDNKKSRQALRCIEEEIKLITETGDKVFLWIHMPHVINGRTCYGSDIDLFDDVVGILRKYFADSGIFISADHGNMNGHKGKLGYGFDVYDPAVRIPLITPRKNNSVDSDALISNIDLYNILFGYPIPRREFVYSDSAYYAQSNRSLAILNGKYKYIYHKKDKKEELFDLEYDPCESFNLYKDYIWDTDRNVPIPSKEEYFYPDWNMLPAIRTMFSHEKDRIWQNPNFKEWFVEFLKVKTRWIRQKLARKKI